MSESFASAAKKLRRGTGRIGDEVDAALEGVAEDVVSMVAPETPVATGQLASSWEADGASVRNSAPYASTAADGIADTLVRGALSELEAEALRDIQQRINRRMGWP